jgi:hypothetical protein
MHAFATAGFMAGVGGALLAGNIGQLDGRAFAASESLFMFALSVVEKSMPVRSPTSPLGALSYQA